MKRDSLDLRSDKAAVRRLAEELAQRSAQAALGAVRDLAGDMADELGCRVLALAELPRRLHHQPPPNAEAERAARPSVAYVLVGRVILTAYVAPDGRGQPAGEVRLYAGQRRVTSALELAEQLDAALRFGAFAARHPAWAFVVDCLYGLGSAERPAVVLPTDQ